MTSSGPLAVALAFLVLCPSAVADEEADVRRWLADLGSAEYLVRETASRELADRAEDPRVRAALEEAARSEDLEVRWRARRILDGPEAEARAPVGSEADGPAVGPGVIIPWRDPHVVELDPDTVRRLLEEARRLVESERR